MFMVAEMRKEKPLVLTCVPPDCPDSGLGQPRRLQKGLAS